MQIFVAIEFDFLMTNVWCGATGLCQCFSPMRTGKVETKHSRGRWTRTVMFWWPLDLAQ